MSKTLVAYFSRAGEQYGVGNIMEGNTAIVGKIIAEKTGADIFEIMVAKDQYPNGYSALVEYAKKEREAKARPEIIGRIEKKYSTVFIGYPNWWGDMPMPVYTFLASNNFAGSNVYYFCTHEGSGGVHKVDFALYGHTAQNDRAETEQKVSEWLEKIGFTN